MPHKDRITQVEVLQQRVEVGGERVAVIADGGLAGQAEPAAVVGDDPAPRIEQVRDLFVPGAAAKRIPMDQHHGLASAMVLIVNLNVGRVLPADSHARHRAFLSVGRAGRLPPVDEVMKQPWAHSAPSRHDQHPHCW